MCQRVLWRHRAGMAQACGCYASSLWDPLRSTWVTAKLFRDVFFFFLFLFFMQVMPNVKENLRVPKFLHKILSLGNCRGHPLTSDLICGNSFVTYLPAKRTSLFFNPANESRWHPEVQEWISGHLSLTN